MFLLESPQRDNFNEYTQYTIFSIKIENHPKLSKICSYGIFSKELKNEFETAMVNEPSVFEPLKFYCICIITECTTLMCLSIGTPKNNKFSICSKWKIHYF